MKKIRFNHAHLLGQLLLVLFIGTSNASEPIDFTSAGLALSVTPPQHWRVVSNAERDERGGYEMKVKGLNEFVRANMDKPFLNLSRPRLALPEPVITMLIAPLSPPLTSDPVGNLARMSQAGFKAFRSYAIVVPTQKHAIDGADAAYTKATYLAPTESGNLIPISFESWLMVRDEYYILIGAVSAEPETDAISNDIQRVVSSIKFK